MYAVVGCSECAAVWLVSDPDTSETARCPRCQTTHQHDRLRHLFESEDREAARQARSALLAEQRGEADVHSTLNHVGELEDRIDTSVIDDREYLEGSGIDADDAFEAGSRALSRDDRRDSRSRMDRVRDGIRTSEEATEDAIVEYAVAHGVPASAARSILTRLTDRGDVVISEGTYRLV